MPVRYFGRQSFSNNGFLLLGPSTLLTVSWRASCLTGGLEILHIVVSNCVIWVGWYLSTMLLTNIRDLHNVYYVSVHSAYGCIWTYQVAILSRFERLTGIEIGRGWIPNRPKFSLTHWSIIQKGNLHRELLLVGWSRPTWGGFMKPPVLFVTFWGTRLVYPRLSRIASSNCKELRISTLSSGWNGFLFGYGAWIFDSHRGWLELSIEENLGKLSILVLSQRPDLSTEDHPCSPPVCKIAAIHCKAFCHLGMKHTTRKGGTSSADFVFHHLMPR